MMNSYSASGKTPFKSAGYSLMSTAYVTLALLLGACSTDQTADSSVEPKPSGSTSELVLLPAKEPEVQEDEGDIAEVSSSSLEEVVVAADMVHSEPVVMPAERKQRTKVGLAKKEVASARLYAPAAQYDLSVQRKLSDIRLPSERTDRENYLHQEDNPVKRVSEEPVSTFSIDVDTAAYSNVRRMVMREGRLPPHDAVKAEEFINYFSYDYPLPENKSVPFSISTELATTPWNTQTQLLQVGLKGFDVPEAERPAANLVFLIDVSGSMQSPFKLKLVKQSLRLLVNQMRANDRIALAVYAGAAGMVLESTPGDQKATIMQAIDNLSAGGSTNGGAGIKLAYSLAQQHFIKGGINRVVIASDGDMNVGTVNLEALKDLIKEKRESGVSLTTLGFGSGNYNFALMEQLADVGNGNAAYIDSLKEAHKVLVKEMSSTLQTIAKDVKIQVEFNPQLVAEYRLIGYENRQLNREDFRNDKVDAGDIGAGHTVTALYEIALVNSGGEKMDGLRYGDAQYSERKAANQQELAYVKLRYKQPDASKSQEVSLPVMARSKRIEQASPNLQFAATVAGYAQLLRGGKYTGEWDYPQALSMARQSKGDDPHGYRGEFISLLELSQSLQQKQQASLQ
jgi:Ca-activated chloride channel homolog